MQWREEKKEKQKTPQKTNKQKTTVQFVILLLFLHSLLSHNQ